MYWINTEFKVLSSIDEEFHSLENKNINGYSYLTRLNSDNVGFARVNALDDDKMLDVGYSMTKSLIKKLNR